MTTMQGRVAVVTGASAGIGRATALLLAERGAAVALLALPGPDLDDAAAEVARIAPRSIAIGLDVGDAAAVTRAFDEAGDALGAVDAVLNNAGISVFGPIATVTDADWARLVTTNLSGSFYVSREAARVMAPLGRGSLVTTCSELALMGQAGYAAYSATKGGILSMTRALAAELGPAGVRVNALCPGPTMTDLFRVELDGAPDPDAVLRENERSIPLGRIGEPAEVARAAVFLLSDDAAFVTGTQLVVDGGRTGCCTTSSPIDR